MKFVGQIEVAEFVRTHPPQAEDLRAWMAEVRHRNWPDANALSADFQSIDRSKPPLTIFRLAESALTIEALIDFRTGVVLLTEIREEAGDDGSSV
jgi:mRNA-degrading endonuclease HigB of HigAB toxin-antitoxin module